MIDDFKIAMRLAQIANVSELIVSRKILLHFMRLPGVSQVRLNVVQESTRFKFLHSIRWNGKLLIHPSERPISSQRAQPTAVLAECKF